MKVFKCVHQPKSKKNKNLEYMLGEVNQEGLSSVNKILHMSCNLMKVKRNFFTIIIVVGIFGGKIQKYRDDGIMLLGCYVTEGTGGPH